MTTNIVIPSSRLWCRCTALALGLTAASILPAQVPAPATAPQSADSDDPSVVELSPFTVNASDDSSWIASNTLAGSRLNTQLRDTPAVLDVLTLDMLEELGIDDLATALALSANFEVNHGDLGDEGGVINSSFTGPGKSINFQTRGQGGSLARNYMPTDFRPDFYTVERIDNSSGPNAILFGLGSAGGVANISTKRARLNRNSQSLQYRFDEHGSSQISYDGNLVLVEGKLGARLNLINDLKEGYREWSDNRMKGVHLAVKARLTERTEINFEFEKARRNDRVVDRRPFRQRLDTWLNAGGQVLTAPVTGNPPNPPAASGVSLFGAGTRNVWTLTRMALS